MPKNDLRNKLTDEQYFITQKKGTEMPFTGKILKEKRNGIYICVRVNYFPLIISLTLELDGQAFS